MSAPYVIVVEGISSLRGAAPTRKDIDRIAAMAVNKTADRARAQAARSMRDQVNFPNGYLSGSNSRLAIRKKAIGSNPQAVIEARQRPTSLARFLVGTPTRSAGATVSVKPGRMSNIRRAFTIKLRSGTASLETAHNLGLAIRLKSGESIRNKKVRIKRLRGNLYLLYGPSVDQVFKTVAEDLAPDLAERLEGEFQRLLEL